MKTVLIAGASGYLGGHLVTEYMSRPDWHVKALVRNAEKARAAGLEATQIVEALATDPDTLDGIMKETDLVISALGITRQKDGLGYMDVDYQANVNLLNEALRSGVGHFAYVHVLNAEHMVNVELVAAKQAFVDELRSAKISSTVICPSGFFSDMADFLSMAREGRVWLFGDGTIKLNPIDGRDLATAAADAVDSGCDTLDIGGPDIFTHEELAKMAFAALDKPARITRLPDGLRRFSIWLLPKITPKHFHGPVVFFLTAMGMDAVGECHGSRHLVDHFASIVADSK